MLKDYLLDRLPKVRVLDVHDDPMHERLRVRLVPGGRQPIDHAYSFRRCLDEGPQTHTEKGDTSQLLGGNYPHTSINWYGQDSALTTRTWLASWLSSATV